MMKMKMMIIISIIMIIFMLDNAILVHPLPLLTDLLDDDDDDDDGEDDDGEDDEGHYEDDDDNGILVHRLPTDLLSSLAGCFARREVAEPGDGK